MTPLPVGFTAHVANLGIKDTSDDLAIVVSDRPSAVSAVFTRSRFAGPAVEVSRRHCADGELRATVVTSKNANVATGEQGRADAVELAELTARVAGCRADEVLVASTGVIGRRLPMERIRAGFERIDEAAGTDAALVARAMMTTDTVPKVASARVGAARIVGVAKGVGMIEPDMATMLAFVYTDAEVSSATLDTVFRGVVERTFNSLSVDSDTSTSDTAAIVANGAAGPVDEAAFAEALESVCVELVRALAADGEGATKLLVVEVDGARDESQAKRAAKAIVNSPLVKTAVHGADPNWGRVVMAIGKLSDDTDIDPERVTICFGDQQTYPGAVDAGELAELESYLAGDEVTIRVFLGTGEARWRVWGCDLSDGYVRINADYTT